MKKSRKERMKRLEILVKNAIGSDEVCSKWTKLCLDAWNGKPEIESGWYSADNKFFYVDEVNDKDLYPGFDNGIWNDKIKVTHVNPAQIPDLDSVSYLLRNEACKRFPKHTKIDNGNLIRSCSFMIEKPYFEINDTFTEMLATHATQEYPGSYTVFSRGGWAEVTNVLTKMDAFTKYDITIIE